jgi:hypothetical protein
LLFSAREAKALCNLRMNSGEELRVCHIGGLVLLSRLGFMINVQKVFSRKVGTVRFKQRLKTVQDACLPVDKSAIDVKGQEAVV